MSANICRHWARPGTVTVFSCLVVFSAKKWLTTAEIISYLEDEGDNILDASIFIEPPEDPRQSDGDSDLDDPEGDLNHLSVNQLRGRAVLQGRRIVDGTLEHFNINELDLGHVIDNKAPDAPSTSEQKSARNAEPQETGDTLRRSGLEGSKIEPVPMTKPNLLVIKVVAGMQDLHHLVQRI